MPVGLFCISSHPPVMDFTPERLFFVVQFLRVPNGTFCLSLQFTQLDGASGFMLCSINMMPL